MEFKQVNIPSKTVYIQSLKVGTPGSNNLILSGCKLVSINFPDSVPVTVSSIEFSNKYTGTITISGKQKIQQSTVGGEGFKFQWRTLLKKKLMPNPHYATGAESRFVVKSSEFFNEASELCGLKFVLQQPSVQFTDFSIEDISVYQPDLDAVSSDSLTKWILSKQEDQPSKPTDRDSVKDFPPLEEVSSLLQKMWALGKKASDIGGSSAQPPRFDKAGCYDINLLSY